jgi:hypothetical protein
MKQHYCSAEKTTISYEGECNWCGEKEVNEYFKKQLEQGATEMFFYGVETIVQNLVEHKIQIKSHKGTLDTFPDLVYIRHMTESIPLFKDPQQ